MKKKNYFTLGASETMLKTLEVCKAFWLFFKDNENDTTKEMMIVMILLLLLM